MNLWTQYRQCLNSLGTYTTCSFIPLNVSSYSVLSTVQGPGDRMLSKTGSWPPRVYGWCRRQTVNKPAAHNVVSATRQACGAEGHRAGRLRPAGEKRQHYCCEHPEDKHFYLLSPKWLEECLTHCLTQRRSLLCTDSVNEDRAGRALHFHLMLLSNSCIGFSLYWHIYENPQLYHKLHKGKHHMLCFFLSHTISTTALPVPKTSEINVLVSRMNVCILSPLAYKPGTKDYREGLRKWMLTHPNLLVKFLRPILQMWQKASKACLLTQFIKNFSSRAHTIMQNPEGGLEPNEFSLCCPPNSHSIRLLLISKPRNSY